MNPDAIIQDAPLLAALLRYADQGRISFHMPGHQDGKGFPEAFRYRLAEIDATELAATDDLNQPAGPAAEAMRAAADAFGAAGTLFVTGGSTTGLYAMITAFCPRGSKLVVSRSVHRSILNIAILLNLTVVFIQPRNGLPDLSGDDNRMLPPLTPPDTDALRQTLAAHPDARAVLVTSPDYYGTCPDLKAMAEVADTFGCPLLVDEAHGAHLCFSPERLPPAALAAGASACVQSAHKTLPALTQGAYLHLASGLSDRRIRIPGRQDGKFGDAAETTLLRRLRSSLSLYQTSSPSLMIGASLDYARVFMSRNGADLIEMTLAAIDRFARSLPAGMRATDARRQTDGGLWRDPLRVVVDVTGTGRTGFDWSARLTSLGVDVEMADIRRLVLIPDLQNAERTLPALTDALCSLATTGDLDSHMILADRALCRSLTDAPQAVLNPGSSLLNDQPTRLLPMPDAVGMIAAEAVIPYPPGIPLIWPGEVLKPDLLALSRILLDNGFCLHGISTVHGADCLCIAG